MVKNKPCFEANPVTGRVIRDPETIATILRLHNEIRSKIARGRCGQPIAGCMRPLQWDPELARVAQKWADQCVNVDYRGDKKRKDPHLFHDKHGQRKTGADENSVASCDQILIQTDFITATYSNWQGTGQNVARDIAPGKEGEFDALKLIRHWFRQIVRFDPEGVNAFG